MTIVPVDNFLRPYLISREAKLPLALIFLGVIGLVWGMIGLFIGPTLLAVPFPAANLGGHGTDDLIGSTVNVF